MLQSLNSVFMFRFCAASVDKKHDVTHSSSRISPLEGVVSGHSFCEQRSTSTQFTSGTTCGRHHVQHDSLFLPAKTPVTVCAISATSTVVPITLLTVLPDTAS